MRAQHWHDVLTLLAMMIMDDKSIKGRESKIFRAAAMTVRDTICPDLNLDEKMARDWYVLHQDDMRRKMSSVYYDKTIADTLQNLNALPEKKELIIALMKIAISDTPDKGPDNRLLRTASEEWNVELKEAV